MPLYKSISMGKRSESLPLYRPLDRLAAWVLKKKRDLLFFVSAIAFLTLLYAGFRVYSASYESRSSAVYGRGEFEEVVRRFPRSRVGQLARMSLGTKAFREGNYDQAIQWLKPAAEAGSPSPFLRIVAAHTAALAHLKKNETDQAILLLESAERDKQNAAPDYSRLLLARAHEMADHRDKAKEIYAVLKDQNNQQVKSQIREEARVRLEWLEKH